MKDTSQKKKGTLMKFFSRLMGDPLSLAMQNMDNLDALVKQYFGDNFDSSLKNKILQRCEERKQEHSERGGQDEEPEQSSFQRGHVTRQTAPADIIRIPYNDSLTAGQYNDTSKSTAGPGHSKPGQDTRKARNLPLTPTYSSTDAGQARTSKMPVIKRALSPPDAIPSPESGEVETTIYRSYRRRSRNITPNSPSKTQPLAAVCNDQIVRRQSLDLSAVQLSPPIPPSKLPDFRLRMVNEEMPVTASKASSVTVENSDMNALRNVKQAITQPHTTQTKIKYVTNEKQPNVHCKTNTEQPTIHPTALKLPEPKNTSVVNIQRTKDHTMNIDRSKFNQNGPSKPTTKTETAKDIKQPSATKGPRKSDSNKVLDQKSIATDQSRDETRTSAEQQADTSCIMTSETRPLHEQHVHNSFKCDTPSVQPQTKLKPSSANCVKETNKVTDNSVSKSNNSRVQNNYVTKANTQTQLLTDNFISKSNNIQGRNKDVTKPKNAQIQTKDVMNNAKSNQPHAQTVDTPEASVASNFKDSTSIKRTQHPHKSAFSPVRQRRKLPEVPQDSKQMQSPTKLAKQTQRNASLDMQHLIGDTRRDSDSGYSSSKSSHPYRSDPTKRSSNRNEATSKVITESNDPGMSTTANRDRGTQQNMATAARKDKAPRVFENIDTTQYRQERPQANVSTRTKTNLSKTKPTRTHPTTSTDKPKTQFLSNSAPVKISELSAILIKSARSNKGFKSKTSDISTKEVTVSNATQPCGEGRSENKAGIKSASGDPDISHETQITKPESVIKSDEQLLPTDPSFIDRTNNTTTTDQSDPTPDMVLNQTEDRVLRKTRKIQMADEVQKVPQTKVPQHKWHGPVEKARDVSNESVQDSHKTNHSSSSKTLETNELCIENEKTATIEQHVGAVQVPPAINCVGQEIAKTDPIKTSLVPRSTKSTAPSDDIKQNNDESYPNNGHKQEQCSNTLPLKEDLLDDKLSNLEVDFAKPLASSTLQRNKKTCEYADVQHNNAKSLTSGDNQQSLHVKVNMKGTTEANNIHQTRESIREKRLQYFSSQATMRTVVVANVNNKVHKNKDTADVLVTIPNDSPEMQLYNSNQSNGIDPCMNINKSCSVPLVTNSTNIEQPTDSVAIRTEIEYKNSEIKHGSNSMTDIKQQKCNQQEHSPDKTNRTQATVTDLPSAKAGQNPCSLLNATINDCSHISDGSGPPNDMLNNTLTTQVDSTLTLLSQLAELDTTLTVSTNSDSIPPSELQFEESIGDSSLLSPNSGFLHYHVRIQDNRNGININVDSTADRTLLDLMDVSQDGIQRLHDDSVVSDRDYSYPVAPDLLSITGSTETLCSDTSTIIAGNDWYLGYLTDNTAVLVNTDSFTDDARSDITCDTTYLVDADAWGQCDDETTYVPSGVCDPVADPLHTNCRLRHIPLQENTSMSSDTSSAQITTRVGSLSGGYPWRRYQELHRSPSQGLTPPWRSGSQHDIPSEEHPRSVRSTSVLRTLVRPGQRRRSTDNLVTTTRNSGNMQTVVTSESTDSNTPCMLSSSIVTSPSCMALSSQVTSPLLIPLLSSSAVFTTSNTASTTISTHSTNTQFNSMVSSSQNASTTRTPAITSPRPIASFNTTSCSAPRPIPTSGVGVTNASMEETAASEATGSRSKPTRNIGYTNAIIEETGDDSIVQNDSSGASNAKGDSARNAIKGKGLAYEQNKCSPKDKPTDRPVATVRPRPRLPLMLTGQSATATSSQVTSVNSTPMSSYALSSYTPSFMVSSTVSIGSRYSAFTPSELTHRTASSSILTRPASAIPSTSSVSQLSSTTRRSITPAANSMDVTARTTSAARSLTNSTRRPSFSTSARRTTTPLGTTSAYSNYGTSSRGRANDDTILESRNSDFVFVDEDINDLSSRQRFSRFGLASTIQPTMRRARTSAASQSNDNTHDSNLTDTFGNVRSLEETVAALRDDIVRVPGALILSIRRNRLVVYLSQDRPNVEGVILFMQENRISRADYEVEILPWGPNTSLHTTQSLQIVAQPAAS